MKEAECGQHVGRAETGPGHPRLGREGWPGRGRETPVRDGTGVFRRVRDPESVSPSTVDAGGVGGGQVRAEFGHGVVQGEELDPAVLLAGGVPLCSAVRVESGHRPPGRPPQFGGVLPGGVGQDAVSAELEPDTGTRPSRPPHPRRRLVTQPGNRTNPPTPTKPHHRTETTPPPNATTQHADRSAVNPSIPPARPCKQPRPS